VCVSSASRSGSDFGLSVLCGNEPSGILALPQELFSEQNKLSEI